MARSYVFLPVGNVRNYSREPDYLNGIEHNHDEDATFDKAMRQYINSALLEDRLTPDTVRLIWSKRKLSWSGGDLSIIFPKSRLREIAAYRHDQPTNVNVKIGELRRVRGNLAAARSQLAIVGPHDVVHIFGHGTWNCSYVGRKEEFADGSSTVRIVTSMTVARMLRDCGLPLTHKWFKVDSCLGGGISAFRDLDEDYLYGIEIFARSLAFDLHNLGYTNAIVGAYPFSVKPGKILSGQPMTSYTVRLRNVRTNNESDVDFDNVVNPFLPVVPPNFDPVGAPPTTERQLHLLDNATRDAQINFLRTDPYRWWYDGAGTRLRAPLPDLGPDRELAYSVELPGLEELQELLRQEAIERQQGVPKAQFSFQFPSQDRRPYLEGRPGGLLREVDESSHVKYKIDANRLFQKERQGKGDRTYTIVGRRGSFMVKVEASAKAAVWWTLAYRADDRDDAPGLEFVHVCRSGTDNKVALGPPLLTVEDIRRTEQNFGYRVDRPKQLTPYDNQTTLDYATQANVPNKFQRYDVFHVPAVDAVNAQKGYGNVEHYRYEAMTVVITAEGEILDVLEWGAHINRPGPADAAECIVYKPTLLDETRRQSDRYLASGADDRHRGLLLAMAFWNRFYYTLIRAGPTDPRFEYLVDQPLDDDDPLRDHQIAVRVTRIEGEGEHWTADVETKVQLPVRVRARRVSAVPLRPLTPLHGLGRLVYRMDDEALLLAVEKLRLRSSEVCARRDPLWKQATRRLEAANLDLPRPRQIRDVHVVEEIVAALAKSFNSAADAASRTALAPPGQGYFATVTEWVHRQERSLQNPEFFENLEEDTHLEDFDATAAIAPILDYHGMSNESEIAEKIRDAGIGAVMAMIDDIWSLYASECCKDGDEGHVTGAIVRDNTPLWFSHLPSLMSEFVVRTHHMVDPLQIFDGRGPRLEPLPSPVERGFSVHAVGFLADLRDWQDLKKAQAIKPSVVTDGAGGQQWVEGTNYGSGRPFLIRETMEFDYRTAVVVTRSPAGAYEQAEGNRLNYLYAVETPGEGFDLEAVQGMLAYIYNQPQRIARSGEKAFSRIEVNGILARRTMETSQVDGEELENRGPEFYLLGRQWEFPPGPVRGSPKQREYVRRSIPPPVLPVPLACFARWAPSFLKSRDTGGALLKSLGAVVGVPDHVWEHDRRAMVWELLEEADNPGTEMEVPKGPLGLLQLREEKPVAKVGMQTYSEGDRALMESLDDVKFTVVEKKPSIALVGDAADSFRGQSPYWKRLDAMFDPEVVDFTRGEFSTRWPVSSVLEPRGFVGRLIGFVAFTRQMRTADAIVTAWQREKQRPRRLVRDSLVFFESGLVPVPESCLMVSRTLEGAMRSAYFAARRQVHGEDDQDLTVAAVQFAPGDVGLDLEALYRANRGREDLPHLPGVKLILDKIPWRKVLGTLKVTIVDHAAPAEHYTNVVDWMPNMIPVEMPVEFHWRAWEDWHMEEKIPADSEKYVRASLPKCWLPTFPRVNGRASFDEFDLMTSSP